MTFILGFLGILKRIPWWVWAFGALAFMGWRWHTNAVNDAIYKEVYTQVYAIRLQQVADRLADEKAAKARALEKAAITERVVVEYRDRIKYVKGKTVEIVKEIYAQVPNDACPVHGSFRVFHDRAAVQTGPIPDAASGTDAAAVPIKDAAETVAENYGICHETADRLTFLQSWVSQQSTVQ